MSNMPAKKPEVATAISELTTSRVLDDGRVEIRIGHPFNVVRRVRPNSIVPIDVAGPEPGIGAYEMLATKRGVQVRARKIHNNKSVSPR